MMANVVSALEGHPTHYRYLLEARDARDAHRYDFDEDRWEDDDPGFGYVQFRER